MWKGLPGGPGRWLGYLPTAAVFALLGFIAYEGHHHGWKWGDEKKEEAEEKHAAPEDGEKVVNEQGDFGRDDFDNTLTRTHDRDKCILIRKEITFKDADSVRKAGIEVGVVREMDILAQLTVTGTAELDQTRVARVTPRAAGILWQISKQPGDPVQPGEVLAIVDSADVGRAKANLVAARVQLDLKQQLRDRLQSGVTPESSIISAEAGLREARVQLQTAYQALLNLGLTFPLQEVMNDSDTELARRLQFLGLPKELGDTLPNEATNNLIAVRNPLTRPAVVLQRDGVQGEIVNAGQTVFVVGDVSRMVLSLNVRQEDARLVHNGMPVRFTPDGDAGEPVEAKIDWVGVEVDPKTRTVKARAYADNPDGRLKAGAFGRATIVRSQSHVASVPEGAVQWEGCSHIVFLREKPNEFEVRKVTLGVRHDGFVQILEGVKPGDPIAVRGSHVLKSDLFRERLGTAEE